MQEFDLVESNGEKEYKGKSTILGSNCKTRGEFA